MKNLKTFFIVVAVAAGCRETPKLELPKAPIIDKFTAAPTTVAKGAMVTLEWATTEATEIEILDVGHGRVAGVDNKPQGSVMVAVTAQSLFVLNASNARGVKVTSLATVSVEGAGQQALFAALPELVAAGGSATLVWNAPGAHQVSITPMGGTPLDLKGQTDTGTLQVSPAAATTYTLTADGTTKAVTVQVAQGITSFTASKALAAAGEMVTLTWKTTNGTKLTLSQPGRAPLLTEMDPMRIADGTFSESLAKYAQGTVVPYLLTVEGAGRVASQEVRIVVGDQPVIEGFTVPQYAKAMTQVTVSWATRNADSIELSTGGTVFYRSPNPAFATSGSVQLDTPATTTDYVLTAVHALSGTRVTRTATLTIVGSVVINDFTVTPATVATGGTPVTVAWNVSEAKNVRVTDSNGHTVASKRGNAAGMGTGTAFPSGAITYTLYADNGVDAPMTRTAMSTATAPAQFGGPDPVFGGTAVDVTWTVGGAGSQLFGYPSTTVDVQPMSTGFTDISMTGTRLTFVTDGSTFRIEDEGIASFTPAFETFFYGQRVTGKVIVSTNGWLAFANTVANARFSTAMLPSASIEPNFVAPYWGDLDIAPGSVYWQVLNEAPEQVLVVQWTKVVRLGQTGELTFQAKVSQTGQVTFEYGTLGSTTNPVVGMQGSSGNGISQAGSDATSGAGLSFFGPRTSPISVTFNTPSAHAGFIKLMNGYLYARYAPVVIGATDIGITEVMFEPNPAIASTGEWLEVTNRSAANLDLAGWTLDFGPAGIVVIDAGVPLPVGASIVLSQTERDAGNDDVATAFVYGSQVAMPDDAGAVSLSLGAFRSAVQWNVASGNSGGTGVAVNTDTQGHLVTGDTSTTPLHGITCSATAPFGSQTPQQRGSPGAFKPCIAAMSSIPVSYFDISATGTALFTADRDQRIAPIDLTSAPFPFAGASVTTVVASTNGWAILKPYTGTYQDANETAPSVSSLPSGSVASIFWDDLAENTTLPSNGYAKRVAAGEDPMNPGAHWIIQWHRYSHWLANDDLNFQIKLFDTGVIEYHYAAMTSGNTSSYGNGNNATVWLENTAGNAALVSSVNQPLVRPNSAIRFTP